MRKIFLFTIINAILLYTQLLYAQTGSLKNPGDTVVLKKGFYKTYQEFLDNSPSILLNFSTKLFISNTEDSVTVAAEYTITDSTELFEEFWGFGDGENIFVPQGGFFGVKYWKLQCKGPNPYYYYGYKRIGVGPGVSGVITAAITASLPAVYELMFIDNNGSSQHYSAYNLKRLLKDNKPLFKEYKNEIYPTVDMAVDYIIRYNEAKRK